LRKFSILSNCASNFFPCRYPIVEALMNTASDVGLAAAVADAGAFPSLWLSETADEADMQLTEFKKLIGHSNLIIPLRTTQFKNLDLVRVIRKHQVSHIEIFRVDNDGKIKDIDQIKEQHDRIQRVLKVLRNTSKLIMRIFDDTTNVTGIDAYAIKGKESAGTSGSWSVKDLFLQKKVSDPDKYLIPYGGIGTPDQVAYYINHGAPAVAVGTLFAASLESPISLEVKMQMVKATADDLCSGHQHEQNQLILGQTIQIDNDDWNRTQQLKASIFGPGDQGFVYAGHSIDHVKGVRPVKEIVEYLCQTLTSSQIQKG